LKSGRGKKRKKKKGCSHTKNSTSPFPLEGEKSAALSSPSGGEKKKRKMAPASARLPRTKGGQATSCSTLTTKKKGEKVCRVGLRGGGRQQCPHPWRKGKKKKGERNETSSIYKKIPDNGGRGGEDELEIVSDGLAAWAVRHAEEKKKKKKDQGPIRPDCYLWGESFLAPLWGATRDKGGKKEKKKKKALAPSNLTPQESLCTCRRGGGGGEDQTA